MQTLQIMPMTTTGWLAFSCAKNRKLQTWQPISEHRPHWLNCYQISWSKLSDSRQNAYICMFVCIKELCKAPRGFIHTHMHISVFSINMGGNLWSPGDTYLHIWFFPTDMMGVPHEASIGFVKYPSALRGFMMPHQLCEALCDFLCICTFHFF